MVQATSENLEWFVDRTAQFAFFEGMLDDSKETAVMLIEAPTGLGKSFLLRKMRQHCRDNRLTAVHVDFRDDHIRGIHDYLWLIREFIDQVGAQQNPAIFEPLIVAINRWTAVGQPATTVGRDTQQTIAIRFRDSEQTLDGLVDLVHVRRQLAELFNLADLESLSFDLGVRSFESLKGSTPEEKVLSLLAFSESNYVLGLLLGLAADARPQATWWSTPQAPPSTPASGAPDEATAVVDQRAETLPDDPRLREQAEVQINGLFIESLRTAARRDKLVVLLDSYEACATETRAWLKTHLLEALADETIDNLRVVIAGQTTHELSDQRPAIRKGPLKKLEPPDVQQYFELRQVSFANRDDGYKASGNGHPHIMAIVAQEIAPQADDDDWD